ncbi:MFS transporter [Streptomyces zingiberis]|uniref:MHS family MFS transporter n=1 Tax=Streptomyces zingiberis TaxID=2053010 RepID=A0ABX1BVG6_9ACTN|nr:MFS transporter [Streptomyces zingiberis]NJQ01697.1 MHS family MFS transporter [Streptomyces zingiberis]
MTSTSSPTPPPAPPSGAAGDPQQLRRAVASSFIGSVIEYYDFLLYGTASAVVFNQIFFSDLDPLAGTVASFGTFAVGYLARPLGGLVFGHFGDRLGRKQMLVITMVLMGVASFLIGCLPTSEQIGSWAAVLLVILRVVQGVAVGGEWGGAVLVSAEHARTRRGLWASFTNAGAPCGMVLSTAAFTATSSLTGDEQFLAWGWRIPFLLSAVLLGVGLFVRLKVAETPVFTAAAGEAASASAPRPQLPLLDVLRNHPRNLLLAVGVGLGAFVAQGALTTYLIAYAVQAGQPRQAVLNALTLSSALAVIGILGWSALSDRVGRRPVVLSGAVLMGAFSFALFPLVDSGSVALLTLAVVVGQSVLHPMMYGPLAALCTELFSTRSRYTGASLGYQLAGMGAGFGPLIFAEVQRASSGGGGTLISLVMAGFCLLTVVSVALLHETGGRSLDDRENAGAGAAGTPADLVRPAD